MAIRWGMIGCGAVTEVKSGPALQKAEGSSLAAVMGRNPAKAEDYARRHGVPVWYDDADRLIRDPGVDAVYIATPPGSHLDFALRVAEAGKPAYVEKPLARSHAECLRMVEAFRKAGVPLFVAYYRRGLPRFRRIRELVGSGALGRVTGIQVRLARPLWRQDPARDLPWRLQAEHAGGGLFLDLASHTLDILDFIFGPLQDIAGRATRWGWPYLVEDAVTLQFTAPGGIPGIASWNFAASTRTDEIVISGDEAELWTPTFEDLPIELRRSSGVERIELPYPPHLHQPLVQSLVAELEGRGRCESTGESAARTSRVMDEALRSYYGDRSGAFWEEPGRWPGRLPWRAEVP